MHPPFDFDKRRAVLISGGITTRQNHPRYLNDIIAFYCCLVDEYKFQSKDVQVVYNNDGLHDLGWRTVPVATKIATRKNAEDAIASALAGLDDDDLFVLFTTNHGEKDTGRLELWGGGEYLTCGNLQTLLNVNRDPYRLGVFGHCYGWYMAEKFVAAADPEKGVAVSASDVKSSSLPPDDMYDAFVYHFTTALQTKTPSGHDVPTTKPVDVRQAFDFVDGLKSYQDLRKSGGWMSDAPALHDNASGTLAGRLTLDGLI